MPLLRRGRAPTALPAPSGRLLRKGRASAPIDSRGDFGLGTAETIGAPRPFGLRDLFTTTAREIDTVRHGRSIPDRLIAAGQLLSPGFPISAPVASDLVNVATAPIRLITETRRLAEGRPFPPSLRELISPTPSEDPMENLARMGIETAALNVGPSVIRGVARGAESLGIAAKAKQLTETRRILTAPVERLATQAIRSGEEAAFILRTLRKAKSPKFRQVFDIVQSSKQTMKPSQRLLTSQRGGALVPPIEPGDLVRFGKSIRRVSSITPDGKKAVLIATAGRSLTVPVTQLTPVTTKDAVKETTGQQTPLPTITEPQALQRSLQRQQTISRQAFQAGKTEEFFSGQQQLVRRSLAGQGRAFRAGERLAQRETRQRLLDEFRVTQREIGTIKSAVVDYAKQTLPPSARGKFLTLVRDAQNTPQLMKAFFRMDREAERLTKRQMIGEIQHLVERVTTSEAVSVDFRNQVKALVSTIRLQGKRPNTLRRLEQIRAFLERQRQQGRPIDLPEVILEKLKTLNQVDATDLSVDDLQRLTQDLELLEQLGTTKQSAREALYAAEKSRKLSALVAETTPLESKAVVTRDPGASPLTGQQQVDNLIASTLNAAQHVDVSIAPMDVIFDRLDGGKGTYAGANHRLIKQALDMDYSNYLDLADAWVKPLQQLGIRLHLKESNFERIAIHAYRVQPNGTDYLLNSGLTSAKINAVVLTPTEQQWYAAARQMLEEPYPQTAEFLRVNQNRDLQKIQNYWPVQTDVEKLSDVQIAERLADAYEGFRRQKNVEQGFTLRRVGGRQPIRLNAMQTFQRHMDDVAYLLSTGRDVKLLTEVARTSEYQQAAGDLGQQLVLDWLDVMARKGGVAQAKRIPVLDMLRRNFGAARLGFKLSSILIQPTALFDGASRLGPHVFSSFYDVASSGPLRQFLRDNFPELRRRGADDPAYLELSGNPALQKYQQAGFWMLQQADVMTASSIVWEAYQQAAKAHGRPLSSGDLQVIPEAVQQAQLVLRRTQASPFFKDLPLSLSRGTLTGNISLDKAILQFKSFMLNRWSLIRHDAVRAGIQTRTPNHAVNTLFWLTLATVAETGIRVSSKVALALLVGGTVAALKKADEELEGFDDQLLHQSLGNVPFLGDLVSLAVYRGSPIPSIGVFQDLATGISSATTGKKPATRLKGMVRTAEGFGGLFGIPGSSQAGQLIREGMTNASTRTSRPRLGGQPPVASLPPVTPSQGRVVKKGSTPPVR